MKQLSEAWKTVNTYLWGGLRRLCLCWFKYWSCNSEHPPIHLHSLQVSTNPFLLQASKWAACCLAATPTTTTPQGVSVSAVSEGKCSKIRAQWHSATSSSQRGVKGGRNIHNSLPFLWEQLSVYVYWLVLWIPVWEKSALAYNWLLINSHNVI